MKIVILDANSLGNDLDLAVFKDFGEVEIYGYTSVEQVAVRIADANVLITNKVVLGAESLCYAPDVKLICTAGTGSDNIDKIYANNHRIKVCNIVGYSTESVAQHTFAMLFYLLENLSYYDQYVKSGRYTGDGSFGHFENQFHELNGKTWGIIGLGNIGKRVGEISKAFGCNVIYYSTSGNNPSEIFQEVSLEILLKSSDIVSIHAPLNENTIQLITYERLKLMKKSAYLLNLGRGKIINEADLTKAIEQNLLAGVGLDVLSVEPMTMDCPYTRLKNNPKLFLTPHVAWASLESRRRMVNEVYLNIEAFIEGRDRNLVK